MQTNNEVKFNFSRLITGIIVIFALTTAIYCFYYSSNVDKELEFYKKSEIYSSHRLLTTVRSYEFRHSMLMVKYMQCQGVSQKKLDSIMTKLYLTNKILEQRDSTYLTEQIEALK